MDSQSESARAIIASNYGATNPTRCNCLECHRYYVALYNKALSTAAYLRKAGGYVNVLPYTRRKSERNPD